VPAQGFIAVSDPTPRDYTLASGYLSTLPLQGHHAARSLSVRSACSCHLAY
jgi:hypothetical protein